MKAKYKLIFCVLLYFAHISDAGSKGIPNTPFRRNQLPLSQNTNVKRLKFQKTVAENTTGIIFQLSNNFQESQTYSLISSTADLFIVDRISGIVHLRSGKSLDYEDDTQRSIQLKVKAINVRTQVTTEITLRITVTDINDASPEFKNIPFPYLATVDINTPANKKIFELYAEDPDTTASIIYRLDSGSDGRFYISTSSVFVDKLGKNVKVGTIYTQGKGQFKTDREYALTCAAVDTDANPVQTAFGTVYVKVGFRPPQFFESPFRATVRENNIRGQLLNNNFKVRTKTFQNHVVSYELRNREKITSSRFSIDADGSVRTQEILDFESVPREQRPIVYELTIIATETVTNLQSTAKLYVEILDDNDNSPIFSPPVYSVTDPENLAVGSQVLEVMATDDDSGVNGELVYSVDHENFDVQTQKRPANYIGIIRVKKRLDYDRVQSHEYKFTVTANDKGTPSASGTANVRVFVTNVNDEPPEIILEDQKLNVREDAQVLHAVTVIQAVDLDNDQVSFYFSPRNTKYEIFEIIPTSGLIRLAHHVPADKDEYVLNITAVDDGSCCGGTVHLSSEAYLNVEITDINTHKPSFPNCAPYDNATILENQPTSSPIINVYAVDDDRGANGLITYSLLQSIYLQNYFKINDTGYITSAIQFDREFCSLYYVTVKGTDHGTPPLDGYCTFRVTIGDVNDNAPKFDLPTYTATISESYGIGRSVITVRADDADLGINAEILYVMVDNAGGYFCIDQNTGNIFLNKLVKSQNSYNLKIMAKDKGSPSLNTTVNVIVNVININSHLPTWIGKDYDKFPYLVDETAPVGYVIASFAATSNVDDPDVFFFLTDYSGNNVQSVPPFGIISVGNKMNITVFSSMDYNVKNRYELLLRVENHGAVDLTSEIHPVVELRDTNNKIPYFQGLDPNNGYFLGSIPENTPPGQIVIEIKAFDDDPTSPNNLLFYKIVDNAPVSDKFSIQKIDDNTAVLKSTASFDREVVSHLFLKVIVMDGTESSRPNHRQGHPNSAVATVQVRITDMNDNPPYFESSYNASIKEDASVQQSVLTVNARDPDDAAVLLYSITAGNVRGTFGIRDNTGLIFVARQLDYETEQHTYTLQITVSDGLYSNTTTTTIHVLDVNDNSPVFNEDPYIITDVIEEDKSITSSNKRLLVTVSATDADINRPTNIRYSLLGFGTSPPNKYFEIEADTGRLYLLTSLDRDLPSGRPNYQFNIRAQDEPDPPPGSDLDQPQFGYTSVSVKPKDINDNSPIFISNLEGSVLEHSAIGSSVMTIVAIDYDEGQNGTVKYEIVEGPSQNAEMNFAILDTVGLITTNTANLDREVTPTYNVVVRASDRGNYPLSTDAAVVINIVDINDHIPVFERQIYKVTMSEAQASGAIAHVKATDNDIGVNAQLDYSIKNYFDDFDIELVNNECNIVVYRALDYENVNQRFFNLTVVVQDRDPTHTATAYVEVTVEDSNDNAPEFVVSWIEVQKYESEPVGTFLAHFSATDADSGINAVFSYYVDCKTDPDRLVSIDNSGNVTIKKILDREKEVEHDFHILAVDKGDPVQTGTATLIVMVLDVNDNFPVFAKDYRPIVTENANAIPELVIDLNATDVDNDPFGAPFGFADTPCSDGSYTCPCTGRSTCTDFRLDFDPSGDGFKGSARISTNKVFDRESKKFYYLPIVMWDMRRTGDPRAMTGTNTLTIEIGDVNDNVHTPGNQDIFVYNHNGMFGPVKIGTVYATDPDDWDVVDKTFTFTGPKNTENYFSVDKHTGVITMQKGVSTNTPHNFTVDVYDRVWNVTVECTVTVTVQDISDEAVFNTGTVRLKGISPEEFVKRPRSQGNKSVAEVSKYDKFRINIASLAKVPVDNVRIVNVRGNRDTTDVYVSVQDKNNYSRSNVNALIAINEVSLEREAGIHIDRVPLCMCVGEEYSGEGCFNSYVVTGEPTLVNTNGTSFVGVDITVVPSEECRSGSYPPSDNCSVDYCHNGGTCRKDDWGDVDCVCLPDLDGPRCQGTQHSFDGNSYALYDPLEQCENSRTSLYIITVDDNGLILYNGPTADRESNSEEPTDFISLELNGGYPRLRIDHGSGVLELYVDGRDQHGIAKMQRLSDGKWHRIDIIRHGRSVDLIVDHCDTALIGGDGFVEDKRMCRVSGTVPGDNIYLNVNTMLQLGGTFSSPSYPSGFMSTNFNGCIKNFMHNNKLYDLTIPGNTSYPSGENRCTREDVICGVDSETGSMCGDNGMCESTWLPNDFTCTCKPGYIGDNCTEDATTRQLKNTSFIQWRLKDSFFNRFDSRKMKMSMMFRTRDPDGILWTVPGTSGDIHMTLIIVNGRLTLTYNLGDGMRNLELYNRFVNNGAWHSVVVERYGGEFILKMDNGEGPNYNFTYGFPNDKQEMLIENSVFAGASVSFADTLPVLISDLEDTCLRDVRMDNEWFPLQHVQDYRSNAATLSKEQHVRPGCFSNDCQRVVCPSDEICYPLWGAHECRCAGHFEKDTSSVCTKINYCQGHNCSNGSTCELNSGSPNSYICRCPPDSSGPFCEHHKLTFEKPVYRVFMSEAQTSGIIATVWVTGNYTDIRYSLENHLDHFRLKESLHAAFIQVVKPVDYENASERLITLTVMAEQNTSDSNLQALMKGSTQVIVTVEDVNDNFPVLAKKYRPIVMENNLNFPAHVATLNAVDADSFIFGAPFGFRCVNVSACLNFGIKFIPDGDGGRGQGEVITHRVFDRELHKFYYLPVLTWDMRGSKDPRAQTGTNTLTIEIGDVNDNKHSPGYKEISVYNYKGLVYPLEIGTVYATDPDDWDLVDKIFTFAEPKYMGNYFSVNYNTGMITMTRPVPGKKTLTFSVDVRDNFWKLTVRSLISVTVHDFDLADISNSVPLRLMDISAEEFIWRGKAVGNITAYHHSKRDMFKKALTDRLSVSEDEVDIFSIQPYGNNTDIWISVQGQGQQGTDNLNNTLFRNHLQIESQAGVTIKPFSTWTTAKYGGHSQLVNTNATSFVGIQMTNQP